MPRVMLTMTNEERQALVNLAKQEMRDPRAQGALILRQALASAGFLSATKAGQPAHPEVTQ